MLVTIHKELGITAHHKANANKRGLIDINLKACLSICVPMQNKPVSKKFLFRSFRANNTSSDGSSRVLSPTAKIKNTTNNGKPDPFFSEEKYQAEKITKGTIHNVRANFRVAATSTESNPITDAAPTTDAVS